MSNDELYGFFEKLRLENNWKCKDDYYKISQKIIQAQRSGYNILRKFDNSPIKFVLHLFPDLKTYKFLNKPQGYWQDLGNQREYFSALREKYELKENDDLYKLTANHLRRFHGATLLNKEYYNGSVSKFVMEMVPEEEWIPFLFSGTPKKYWESEENQKFFFEYLCDNFEIKEEYDYYGINQSMIYSIGGSGLLVQYFRNSPSDLVMKFGPGNIDWKKYKFRPTPVNYWREPANIKNYFTDLSKHYNLIKKDDYYSLTEEMVHDFHGDGLLTIYYNSSPKQMVIDLAEFDDWEEEKFSVGRKTQKLLYRIIKEVYPDAKWEYKFDIKWDGSSRHYIGVDIFIPSRLIAIEGQGVFHYKYIENMYGGSEERLQRIKENDFEKMAKLRAVGIKMIHVPFCEDDPKLPKWEKTWESFVEIAKLQGHYFD